MIGNIVKGWFNVAREQLGVLPSDIKDMSESRLSVCNDCTKRLGFICGVCGCVLTAKTKVVNEKCPIGEW
jgi:hypothetical protein